jgi:hypothetical protein
VPILSRVSRLPLASKSLVDCSTYCVKATKTTHKTLTKPTANSPATYNPIPWSWTTMPKPSVTNIITPMVALPFFIHSFKKFIIGYCIDTMSCWVCVFKSNPLPTHQPPTIQYLGVGRQCPNPQLRTLLPLWWPCHYRGQRR